ncbi:MAG TPA: hypothetical protein VH120_13895 [Gemmataceae bacterium]|nr:hypothetical protein [Gemmataceae bacterium]
MPTEEALAIVSRPNPSGGWAYRVREGDTRPLEFWEWLENDYKLTIYSWEGRVAAKEFVSLDGSYTERLRGWLGLH